MAIFDENWVKRAIFAGSRWFTPLYGRAGPLTSKNLRGVTPGPGVREHGSQLSDVFLLEGPSPVTAIGV